MGLINYVLFEAWSWIPWVLGLGTIGWIALALLAPGVLSIISPLLRGVVEGIVEFFKIVYEGLKDILDSWKTVVTVLFLAWLLMNYKSYTKDTEEPTYNKPRTSKALPFKKTSPKEEGVTNTLPGWEWFHK